MRPPVSHLLKLLRVFPLPLVYHSIGVGVVVVLSVPIEVAPPEYFQVHPLHRRPIQIVIECIVLDRRPSPELNCVRG